MNKSLLQSLRPLLLIFVFTTAFFIISQAWLEKKGVDTDVLIGGNLVLFAVSFLAFFVTYRALRSNNPNAFVRAIYGSFMIKFFLVAIAAFIYIMIAKAAVNKPALLACAGLYIIYTGIEIRSLTKMLKNKKNA